MGRGRWKIRRWMSLLPALLALWGLSGAPARAAEPAPVPCGLGMVDGGFVQFANAGRAVVPQGKVRVTYVGHSTYFLETPDGASIATDYNGVHQPRAVPHIVTMNNRHETHYTEFPDPNIKFVLRGWKPGGGIARHHMRHRDIRVYNLPTNIFDFGQGPTNRNSVFVFEAAGICFAHLGHLAHFLSKEQVRRLGRIDVLFVPIDGFSTLSHEEAMHIIGQIKPRLIMPMHFSFGGPENFLALARTRYPVRIHQSDSILLNRAGLPEKTEVLFLAGGG